MRKINIPIKILNSLHAKYINGQHPKDLCKDLNISETSLRRKFQEAGLRLKTKAEAKTKYKIDEKFFSKIDNQEKAYILGFIYADGSIRHQDNGLGLSIHIQEKDIEILEFIKHKLQSDAPILFYGRKKDHYQNTCLFLTSNYALCSDLIAIGCGIRKTYNLQFPDIEQDLYAHFIRGYFDGDGCVSKKMHKNRYECIRGNIVGQEKLLLVIQRFFKENGINSHIKETISSDKGIKALSFDGNIQMTKLYNLLYKNASFFLKRKKNIFIETLKNKGYLNEDLTVKLQYLI